MAKLQHGPITTPESFNTESDRLRWPVRFVPGPVPDLGEGWHLVERDTGALLVICPHDQALYAISFALWHVENQLAKAAR